MTFTPHPMGHYTIYKNKEKPKLGFFIKYSREGYYDFGIGDYTIPSNFLLSFDHKEELIRFGTVYKGETNFQIEDSPLSSFSPSSFFVAERGLKGKQAWKKGQHFHGAEITNQRLLQLLPLLDYKGEYEHHILDVPRSYGYL